MRRVTSNLFAQNQPYFEYYTNSIPGEVADSSANISPSNIENENRYESLPQMTKDNHSFTSPTIIKSSTLPSSNAALSSEKMTSQEKWRYKKALKDIYDTVKVRAQRLEIGSDISQGYTQSDADKPSSEITPESPTSGKRLDKPRNKGMKRLTEIELQEIYQELRVISRKLKDETQELQSWEENLYEREVVLRQRENTSRQEMIFEEELERRYIVVEEEYQANINELQKALFEKSKEANRLRDSFNTIRSAHEELRKQFLDIQDKNRVLESQTLSLQQRFNNLLRKNEHQGKQREALKLVKHEEKVMDTMKRNINEESIKVAGAPKFNLPGILDVLASLLIWVSDSQLDYNDNKSEEKAEADNKNLSKEHIYGKCVKILPPLADLLSCLPTVNPNVVYPLLKFLYSVILYMDQTHQSNQKPVLTSTLRRIGEELYKPEIIKQTESQSLETKRGKRKVDIYLRSSNLEERMLSTLIVLKTTSRADYLSHTFDFLKSDLREEMGKRLFIHYNGVRVVLPFLKQKNKTFLESAVDVILQMSMESGVVSAFLTCCSTSDFFNVCTSLMQEKGFETKILEKFSIVLQRLSKIRSNRRYFEAFQLIPLMQDLLREHDTQNAFLSLNLRSILVNLNVKSV